MFPILQPHTVTVLTTDKCTAECRHCCMNSSPERENRLSYEQIERSLSQMFQHYHMLVVVFAGGEPTLIGKDLLKAIRFCKQNGVITRIVSNGYWAVTLEAARAKCAELKEAGLDELNISMDDYHEPYVPFERVKFAHQAGMEVGFKAVVMANACGPQSVLSAKHLESEFGMKDVKVQKRWDVDGKSCAYEKTNENNQLVILSNGNVQRLGRGMELIADDEMTDHSYEQHMGRLGGCPHAVRSAAISPRNHMLSCCGFELHGNPILDFGDLDKVSVKEALDRADDDVIVNMIGLIGPPKVMALLKDLAPEEVSFPRKRYQSYCEVCHDLVGLEINRKAMYKYQGMFQPLVVAAREAMAAKADPETGRVPIGVHVKLDLVSLHAREARTPAVTLAATPFDPVA